MVYHVTWIMSVSLIDTYIHASANTQAQLVNRTSCERTWGREANPHGQFFGPLRDAIYAKTQTITEHAIGFDSRQAFLLNTFT